MDGVNGVKWRKSSYTGANGGDCVEIANLDRSIAVRDSKAPNDGTLRFTPGKFCAFLAEARQGKYDI
jgi:hypothetical protein